MLIPIVAVSALALLASGFGLVVGRIARRRDWSPLATRFSSVIGGIVLAALLAAPLEGSRFKLAPRILAGLGIAAGWLAWYVAARTRGLPFDATNEEAPMTLGLSDSAARKTEPE